MSVWTITNPAGAGAITFAAAGIEFVGGVKRLQSTSTMKFRSVRDFDSVAAWWADDAVVIVYRDGNPFFTGRAQEAPISASGRSERRELNLADGWKDLEDITYQESWGFGSSTVLMPKAVLGLSDSGARISTGEQIEAVIDYAIANDALLQKGTIDAGVTLWPSEVANTSCADVIIGELALNIDWVAWLDHSVSPPRFNARPKSALGASVVDVAEGHVSDFSHARLVRDKVNGVRIIYESATQIDNEVFRQGYLEEAGSTTGRKVIQATVELEGIKMQFQKSRIETRTLPTTQEQAKAYLKLKFPALAEIPDAAISITKWERTLASDGSPPPAISAKAPRLEVVDVDDVPRELVRGNIEDWMRVKVRPVTVTYDMTAAEGGTAAQQDILENFAGKGKTFTITCTDAVTKRYKSLSQFTEGEGRPTGIAAAVYAAASADAYEGSVTIKDQEIPTTEWMGRTLRLINGAGTVMPAEIIHSSSFDIEAGEVTLECGPLPWLGVNDFYELQRRINQRPVTWWSTEERASNRLGAEESAGSRGDTIGGFDAPQTIVPPGGGGTSRELNPLQGSFRDDDGTWKLKFVPGYVRISTSGGDGEIVPGIGGVAIDAEDPPELSVVNANRIYLKVTASFTSPQSATVTIENLGASSPNSSVTSTGFTGYFFIAQFFEGAGSPTLNQGQGGNVQVMVWGASIFFWRL